MGPSDITWAPCLGSLCNRSGSGKVTSLVLEDAVLQSFLTVCAYCGFRLHTRVCILCVHVRTCYVYILYIHVSVHCTCMCACCVCMFCPYAVSTHCACILCTCYVCVCACCVCAVYTCVFMLHMHVTCACCAHICNKLSNVPAETKSILTQ